MFKHVFVFLLIDSLDSIFSSFLCQCCVYSVIRRKHKNHFLEENNVFWLKILILFATNCLDMFQGFLKSIQWCFATIIPSSFRYNPHDFHCLLLGSHFSCFLPRIMSIFHTFFPFSYHNHAVLWRLIILSEREMDRETERKGKERKIRISHLEEAAGHWRVQTL